MVQVYFMKCYSPHTHSDWEVVWSRSHTAPVYHFVWGKSIAQDVSLFTLDAGTSGGFIISCKFVVKAALNDVCTGGY